MHTESDYLEHLEEYDLVFKTPGIVLPQPVSSYRCQIVSQTEVFFRRFRQSDCWNYRYKRKKHHDYSFVPHFERSWEDCILAGNIGIPAFDMAEQVGKDTIIVFEMSCHQLEYLTVSPRIALLLNIHEEHLDHYGNHGKICSCKTQHFPSPAAGRLVFLQ